MPGRRLKGLLVNPSSELSVRAKTLLMYRVPAILQGGTIINNPEGNPVDLTTLPLPAFHLLDLTRARIIETDHDDA